MALVCFIHCGLSFFFFFFQSLLSKYAKSNEKKTSPHQENQNKKQNYLLSLQ